MSNNIEVFLQASSLLSVNVATFYNVYLQRNVSFAI